MTAEEAAGIDQRAGQPSAPGRRPAAGLVHQFLYRQSAALSCRYTTSATTLRPARTLTRLFPTRACIGVADARSAARRRQYSLYYPASPAPRRRVSADRQQANGTLLRARLSKVIILRSLIRFYLHNIGSRSALIVRPIRS